MPNSATIRRFTSTLVFGCLLFALFAIDQASPAAAFGMFGFGGMRGGGFVGPGPGARMPPPRFGGPGMYPARPPGRGGWPVGHPPIVGGGGGGGGVGNGGGNGGGASGGNNNNGGGAAQSTATFVPDEILTAFAAGTTPQSINQLAGRYNLTPLETQNFALIGTSVYRWRVGGGRSVANVIRALGGENIVANVQPNYIFTLQDDAAAAPPSAQSEAPPQYVLDKLQVAQAQRIATGKNVLVAVIDSAIDPKLPELDGVIAKSFDAIGGAGDPHAHGTSIAGAIAAHGKLVGIAPGVQLLAIRAFDDSPGSAKGTSFAIDKGLQWAADNGARIVNMSFAGPADPTLQRMLAAAYDKGIVLIAAAGNAGPKSDPLYPGADPSVIAVTATDSNDRLFEMANRGRYVAVAAPGVDILALAPGDKVQFSTGTSIAAAHVSGIVALLLEHNPALKPADIRAVLTVTCKPLGPPHPDSEFGAGLVSAYRAVSWLDRKPAEAGTGDAQAKQ